MNFAKFLRTLLFTEHLPWLFLDLLEIGAALLLQIEATVVTNRNNLHYKSGKLLQIGAIITNRCSTLDMHICSNHTV